MKKSVFYIILILVIYSCSYNVRSKYPTFEDYKKSSLRKQSWYPDFLSNDCYQLLEIHNIETNNSFGRFQYSNDRYYDSVFQINKELKTVLFPVFKNKIENIKEPSKPDWFPKESDLLKMQLYKYQSFYVAIDKSRKIIFFAITY